jgi:hypothetical protein
MKKTKHPIYIAMVKSGFLNNTTFNKLFRDEIKQLDSYAKIIEDKFLFLRLELDEASKEKLSTSRCLISLDKEIVTKHYG